MLDPIKDIYNNKIITAFQQIPDIDNMSPSEYITSIEQKKDTGYTYNTEESLLWQDQNINANNKDMPAKQQIPTKYYNRTNDLPTKHHRS